MPGYPISSASNTAPTIVDLDSGRRKFNSPVTAVRSCPEARPATGHGAVFVQTSIQRADRPPDHPARRSRAPSRQAGRYYASFHFWGKIPVDRSTPCQIKKSSTAGKAHAPASIGKHLQHGDMVLTATNLSNGAPTLLRAAVSHAILGALPDAVLSITAVGVLKPQPDVYALAARHFSVLPDGEIDEWSPYAIALITNNSCKAVRNSGHPATKEYR